MSKFNVGDVVICIDRKSRGGYNSYLNLREDKDYTIEAVDGSKVSIKNIYGTKKWYSSDRFELKQASVVIPVSTNDRTYESFEKFCPTMRTLISSAVQDAVTLVNANTDASAASDISEWTDQLSLFNVRGVAIRAIANQIDPSGGSHYYDLNSTIDKAVIELIFNVHFSYTVSPKLKALLGK